MITCTNCQSPIAKYEVFPNQVCLICHALDFDSKPMPTAQDIAQMWGGK